MMTKIASALLSLLFLSSCGRPSHVDITPGAFSENTNYHVENVSVRGPDFLHVVWNSSDSTAYTITFDIVAHDASGGVVAPIVSLIDQDAGTRFGDDLLSEEQFSYIIPARAGSYAQTAQLSLGCSAVGNVVGQPVQRDSGEGKPLFLGAVDSADVYALVQKADGTGSLRSPNLISVDCER